jgi:hypothetical protein
LAARPSARDEPGKASGGVAVEIEVRGRWDALALSKQLIPFHSYLVQYGPERWVVHARSPGWNGEPLDAALAVIGEWQDERATEAYVRVEGQLQGGGR